MRKIDMPVIPAHIPDLTKPRTRRTKVKVAPQVLPLLATVCPAQIVGSEQCDGNVILVLEGVGLPDAEFCTLHMERESDGKMSVEGKAINA